MHTSSQDSAKYFKAVTDMAHLIKVFGSREVLLDLKQYFPDQYEDMIKALNTEGKTKQLARLLDASEGRCSGTGVESLELVSKRPSSSGGNK